ncbi:MAG TPA: thiamine pyrophosphate-dependent dehydrogenase E1 component subunit alpha [Anaerolineae bacterium]|jgi:pyruvate dehydrogenase E1 component alpha subunit|nr:thiamine pyrophosphate-dependent dehydrogenase E1 component subunit alpha [Anaerolineae bacterium]
MEVKSLELNTEQLMEIYYFMRLGRAIEERLELLYKGGRLPGAIYLGRGQEAIEVGASYALEPGDVLAPTHRDMMSQLPRGITAREVFAQHYARANSLTHGKGEDNYQGDLKRGTFATVSMLPNFYPVATGAALAFKLRKEKRVAMPYSGEGATSRGDWHESLNIASVQNLPVVFIVINNGYAYSTPVNKEMKVANVADRACAYAMPGVVVDGNDVLECYREVKKAVERARDGGGPTLIEAKTMRMRGHAGHDPAKYMATEIIDLWTRRDPIVRFENYLTDRGLLSEESKQGVINRVTSEVEDAVRFAEESPYPEGKEAIEDVYAQ